MLATQHFLSNPNPGNSPSQHPSFNPWGRIEAELIKKLILALYVQELLSFGKVHELPNLDYWRFGQSRVVSAYHSSSYRATHSLLTIFNRYMALMHNCHWHTM